MDAAHLTPAVSVLLPCRNEAEHIDACVQSLLQQDPVDGGFEILILDGQSDDTTRIKAQALARQYPGVRVLDNPQRIVSTALNIGINQSQAPILIRVDAHTIYAPDYLRTCVAVLHQTAADNVGGPARTRAEHPWQRAVAAAYHSPFSTGGARFHDVNYEGWVDTVTYGCWPRATFAKVGLFDETLARNQDDEHNLRIWRAGGRIWQSPRIVSWYTPRARWGELFRQYLQYGYWKIRVMQKHRTVPAVRHVVPAGCCGLAIALSVASVVWPRAAQILGTLVLAYVGVVLIASVAAGRRESWRVNGLLPVVFATYHAAYGLGCLWGLWRFLVRRRGNDAGFATLSRGSSRP